MEISVKGLASANLYDLLKFAFHVSKSEVQNSFARAGILVENEADLKALADLHDRGADKAGEFKNLKGEPIYFDVEDILVHTEIPEEDKQRHESVTYNWH